MYRTMRESENDIKEIHTRMTNNVQFRLGNQNQRSHTHTHKHTAIIMSQEPFLLNLFTTNYTSFVLCLLYIFQCTND